MGPARTMLVSSVVRSSLEEMLECLQRRDEIEDAADDRHRPPCLPSRPRANSRTRPPSSYKRRLPTSIVPDSDNANSTGAEKEIAHSSVSDASEATTLPAKEADRGVFYFSSKPQNARHQGGTLDAQRCDATHSHCNSGELKAVATALQSYVRGEIARENFRRNLKRPQDKAHDTQLTAAVLIQSVIRGWLVRNHHHQRQRFIGLDSSTAPFIKNPLPPRPRVVEELQERLLMAEAALGEKEKEIKQLRRQVEQLEAKLKSMEEEMKHKNVEVCLDTAKKNAVNEPQRQQNGRGHRCRSEEEETTSIGSLTPGCGSPARFIDFLRRANSGGASNSIIPLVNEFDQRKQLFDLEAQALVEAKPETRQTPSSSCAVNPLQEVQALKHRFDAWKKDFGFRLREAKAKASRTGHHEEGEKQQWRWWGLKRRRS